MKVLHLVPALFDAADGTLGGAERYVFELARHMATRVPTTLLSFGERAREERTPEGLRVRVLSRPWRVRGQRHNPLAWGVLPETLRADVVHCHQTHVVASSLAAAIGRLTGRRVFTTDLGGGGWDVSAYVSTDRWFHGHLHLSDYSRRVSGHEGFSRAHVILGGVDGEKFSPAVHPPLSPPIADAPVLFVGRLFPHKGLDDLIAAVPRAGEEPPDLRLEVIGRPGGEEYFRYLTGLAAGRPVTFRTECTDADLVAALRGCLGLVLPSVYRTSRDGAESRVPELLGQTLLEAMACARPVVCTAVASMPEIVVDGETGFVVPPNDPVALRTRLRWLRAHPGEASALGVAGRRRVLEHFSWRAVVERCLRLYQKDNRLLATCAMLSG